MKVLFLSSLIPHSTITAIVGLVFLVYALRINKDAHINFIRIGVLLVVQLILLVTYTIITDSNADKKSRLQLRNFLDNKDIRMTVGDKLLDTARTKELSKVLASIADLNAHHSHPIDKINIQIISETDTLNLTLGRDSEIETEYWVFSDKHMTEEIGRISTELDIKNGL